MTVNVTTQPTLLDRILSGDIPDDQIINHLQPRYSRFKVKHKGLLKRVMEQDEEAMAELIAIVCDIPLEVVQEIPITDYYPLVIGFSQEIQASVGKAQSGKN